MELEYIVTLHREGQAVWRARVPAKQCGLVGDYHNGLPYQPDADALTKALPHSHKKAFERALGWWQTHFPGSRPVPLKCELTSTKGYGIGVLFATPDWPVV
jgi:hypothetical protein